MRPKTFASMIAVAGGAAVVTIGLAILLYMLLQPVAGDVKFSADAGDEAQVALGAQAYAAHCASCHGDRLQGQPDWQSRKPDGKLPAPPHDATGHTWHHADQQLFKITKYGLEPYAPAGYKSDMPAFKGILSDRQIAAVLAYIKKSWLREIRERQARINDGAQK
ncbi:MAG: c-type cytochrome [Rhodospirillales bacterium]